MRILSHLDSELMSDILELEKPADSSRQTPEHMDAAEYKHVELWLIFLKYISDDFDELSKS